MLVFCARHYYRKKERKKKDISSISEARNIIVPSVTVKSFKTKRLLLIHIEKHGKNLLIKIRVLEYTRACIIVTELLHWNPTAAHSKTKTF